MKKLSEAERTWVRLGLKALIIIVVLWISFGVFVGFRRISDFSMNGRINDGDFVLFNRISKDFHAGDIVIYNHEDRELLSEIVGVENDLITVDEEGYLVVNEEIVSKAPVYDYALGETNPFGDGYRVPTGAYFVLNSNYESTNDSRSFGAVYAKDIKGSIIALLLRTRSF